MVEIETDYLGSSSDDRSPSSRLTITGNRPGAGERRLVVAHEALQLDALVAVGGSLSMWLIATTLKRAEHARQRDIAGAIGLEDAILTHHLHRMEGAGVVSRHRAPTNRRNQIVTLTPAGEDAFQRMLATAIAFDERLRRGFTTDELDQLRGLLGRLRTNVAVDEHPSPRT